MKLYTFGEEQMTTGIGGQAGQEGMAGQAGIEGQEKEKGTLEGGVEA